jgi:ferritin-like metal-binding protein YciE
MPETGNLHASFVDELRDVYDGEHQLLKALTKLSEAATSDDLREAFDGHRTQTQGHVDRLDQIFQQLDEKPKGKHCAGIAGIIEEGKTAMDGHADDSTRDARLIAAGQRAEHYEIAVYGTLVAWADTMGHNEVAELLRQTLDEEKAADEKLTEIAEGGINEAAAGDMSADGEARESGMSARTADRPAGHGTHARTTSPRPRSR